MSKPATQHSTIAARKSYLPDELAEAVELEPIVLPPWDPMGSLAG